MRAALVLGTMIVLACADREPQNGAESARASVRTAVRPASPVWYLEWRPEPTGDRVGGLPLPLVDSAWVAASVLDELPLPAEAYSVTGERRDGLEESGARFLVEEDLNGDGQAERALVGVFRTATGEEGRFLVILERDSVQTWRKAFLATMPDLGFSVLTRPSTELIVWADCLTCDTSTEIRWNGKEYEASFFSCCPDEDAIDSAAFTKDSPAGGGRAVQPAG